MLKARSRAGLIRDITEVVAKNNVNILDFGKEERVEKEVSREVVLEITDDTQFKAVLASLNRVRDVLKAEKVD